MIKGASPGRIYRMEEVTVIRAVTLQDYVHIYVSILSRENVTKQVSRIKKDCALMLFDEYLDF